MGRDDVLHAIEDGLLIDLGFRQDPADIDNLHVPDVDLEDGQARGDLAGDPPGHAERLLGPDDRDDDVVIVHDVVREHDPGDILRELAEVAGEEEGGTADAVDGPVDPVELRQELVQRDRLQGSGEFLLAAHIDHDDGERDERNDKRPEAPGRDLLEIRQQEEDSDEQHSRGDEALHDLAAEHKNPGDHDRSDRHRPADRKTVGMGEVVGCPEDGNNQEDGKEEQPVHDIDVDLRPEAGRGIFNPQERQDAGGQALVHDREDARDHGLGGNDRCGNTQEKERYVEESEFGSNHLKEDIVCTGMGYQKRPLAEVIEGEGDKDDMPGPHDRAPSQVSHIRVQRLPPVAQSITDDRIKKPASPLCSR